MKMNKIKRQSIVLSAVTTLGLFCAIPASAESIHTGGKNGAYFNDLCPMVKEAVGKAYFKHKCEISSGTGDNVKKVIANPTDVGIGQADLLARLSEAERAKLTIVDAGVGVECLYAVTNDASITDLDGLSARIPVALPNANSGSALTFAGLQKLDKGLASLRDVTNYGTPSQTIAAVAKGDAALAFFIQIPNKDNAIFEQINSANLNFLPVISRDILRQEVGGTALFTAANVNVVPQGLLSRLKQDKPPMIETACTNIVFFTGSTAGLEGNALADQKELVAKLAQVQKPKTDRWSKMLEDFSEMSSSAIQRLTK